MSSVGVLLAVAAEILWTRPICVETNRYIGWPTVCVRKSGELMVAFSGDRDDHVCPFGKVQIVRSTDGGETWSLPQTIRNSSMDDRDAGLIELADGTLLVHLRCHGGDRRTVQCESHDGGRTWGPVHETGILGYPSHLLRLKNGLLLATYASRDAGRYGEYACVSFDDGKNWDVKNEICLTRHFNADLGYPSTAELTNGTLVSVYYQARQPDEKPCLMATKWNLSLMKKE